MIASTLLSNMIVPLQTSDKGAKALRLMQEYYVRHLPVINNGRLFGILSEDDVLDNDEQEPIGSYALSMNGYVLKDNDHLFEALRLVGEHGITVVPVIDQEEKYLGAITQEDLIRHFANMGAFKEPGSIIVLEMIKTDYSLAEIARIVESENAAILSTLIATRKNSSNVEVTIKVNKQDIDKIIAAFDRFDYRVKASFQELEFFDSLKERYDALMTYLNV